MYINFKVDSGVPHGRGSEETQRELKLQLRTGLSAKEIRGKVIQEVGGLVSDMLAQGEIERAFTSASVVGMPKAVLNGYVRKGVARLIDKGDLKSAAAVQDRFNLGERDIALASAQGIVSTLRKSTLENICSRAEALFKHGHTDLPKNYRDLMVTLLRENHWAGEKGFIEMAKWLEVRGDEIGVKPSDTCSVFLRWRHQDPNLIQIQRIAQFVEYLNADQIAISEKVRLAQVLCSMQLSERRLAPVLTQLRIGNTEYVEGQARHYTDRAWDSLAVKNLNEAVKFSEFSKECGFPTVEAWKSAHERLIARAVAEVDYLKKEIAGGDENSNQGARRFLPLLQEFLKQANGFDVFSLKK